MPAPPDRPLRLFVSFAPEDRELKDELLKHLAVLQRIGKVEPWSVDQVRAGGDWRQEVEAALTQADVALLLLSADFLASNFLQDVEVPTLFDRRTNDGLHVIPIVLRTCPWQFHPWICELKALPTTEKAVAAYQGDARDQVLTEIAVEIAGVARDAPQPTDELGFPWTSLTHSVSLKEQDPGRNVLPVSYQFSARPIGALNATKAALQDALEKSVQLYDIQDFQRVARWPRPLAFGRSEIAPNGSLLWRHSYDEASNSRGEEQFHAAAKPVTLAYQRATFWDNATVAVDFGMMAFDLCFFVRFALLTVSNLALLAAPGSSNSILVTASLAGPPRPTTAHFSHGITPADGGCSGTFRGGFIGGEPVEVLSSSIFYTGLIGTAAKTMLDDIANEFALGPSLFGQSRAAFLSIDRQSIGCLIEQWLPKVSMPLLR